MSAPAPTLQPQLPGFAAEFPDRALSARWWQFHLDNPDVYRELVDLARQWRARGWARIGIAALFEVLRWQRAMRTDGDQFKLNNSYRSRYARLIMVEHPDLDGMFSTRELRTR